MGISPAHPQWLFVHCFQIELELGNVGFCGGRETRVPGEKPSEQGREPTTNSADIWRRVWESNPGHNGHPCSPYIPVAKEMRLISQEKRETKSPYYRAPVKRSNIVGSKTWNASRAPIFFLPTSLVWWMFYFRNNQFSEQFWWTKQCWKV